MLDSVPGVGNDLGEKGSKRRGYQPPPLVMKSFR
jgi:hypothetical protein